MDDLISKIKTVSINDVEDVNNRYIRSFILGIVGKDFQRTMIEHYKRGLNYITFLQYRSTDMLVFGLFHKWEIVSYDKKGVVSFAIKDLVASPSFWDLMNETFPDFFISLDTHEDIYYLNIYWDL